MARYFIESVQCGIGEGGMACGPMFGPVLAEIKVRTDGDESFYLSLADVSDIPNFTKSPESTYESQLAADFSDEELERFHSYYLGLGDYYDIFEAVEDEYYPLYRSLIYLVKSDDESCRKFKEALEGRWIDEVDVPMTEMEQEFREE